MAVCYNPRCATFFAPIWGGGRKDIPCRGRLLEIDSSWATIVERYLQACYQEDKLQREARLTSSLAKVFREFGSEFVAEKYSARAKDDCQSLLAPPHPREWELINNSEFSVTVEIHVEANGSFISQQVPFFPTRLLLAKRSEGDWQIDDLLNPCIHCNLNYPHSKTIAGQCSLCDGKGHRPFNEDPACTYCSGTGKCPNCKDDSMPGWRREAFLRPFE
jgi:hypothetical protein